MTTLSIISICQDEAEVIPWYLDCCEYTYRVLGPKWLKEVVIVDGGSVDKTIDIIKSYQDRMPLVLVEHPFDTFGAQKNRALDVATGEFILACDTDMSWTTNFGLVFKSGYYENFEMVDFRMMFTVDDEYHYFKWPPGVNMRLWKNCGRRYVTGFHEKLQDQQLLTKNMGGLPVCEHVVLFENSFRQSDAALLNRGQRYQRFFKEMADEGKDPGGVDKYFNAKHCPPDQKAEMHWQLKELILPQIKTPI